LSKLHHWRLSLLSLAFAAGAASLPLAAAAAAIFVSTADDGTISLSNLQEDGRYKLLLSDGTRSGGEVVAASAKHSGVRSLSAKASYDDVVGQVAGTYGIDSALLHAVISVESGYNARAVSPKGASGLMQLMPQTARRYGVANALDPLQNLHGGARYLRDLLALFNSDLPLVLAAYNAGENAVARHGNQIPPYRETVAYVPKVLSYYAQYQGARAKP
jgi:soluble lytic murein transglycosylase-like protein